MQSTALCLRRRSCRCPTQCRLSRQPPSQRFAALCMCACACKHGIISHEFHVTRYLVSRVYVYVYVFVCACVCVCVCMCARVGVADCVPAAAFCRLGQSWRLCARARWRLWRRPCRYAWGGASLCVCVFVCVSLSVLLSLFQTVPAPATASNAHTHTHAHTH